MRRLLVPLLILMTGIAIAQDAPTLTTTETQIGIDCPEAQALSPDGTALYVLMMGCVTRTQSLLAFSVADGTPLDIGGTYTDELAAITGQYVYGRENAMAFTPDGTLSIISSDQETYVLNRLLLPVSGGDIPGDLPDSEAIYNALLPYTEFPEYAIFSRDHTMAAATNADSMNVVSLITGELVLSVPVEMDSYNAFPTFAPDNQSVYVAVLDDIDDIENYNATVSVYSLPDGDLLTSFTAPSPFLSISPDGTMAAALWGSSDNQRSELWVFDTATGTISDTFSVYEARRPATTCTNDGSNIGIDATVSGHFSVAGITWRPDSSGFLVTRSYYGEGMGRSTPCTFNTSRLNVFDVTRGE